MILAPSRETDLGFEPRDLAPGAGVFRMRGGASHRTSRFDVHYVRPVTWSPGAPVLIVIPGSGRNSAEYRNAWLAPARARGILVAALGYPETEYDFAAYQMGSLVRDLTFRNAETSRPNARTTVIRLRDEDISFSLNPDRQTWLFNDFDRVFDHLRAATGASSESYDIFGHSAGAQILHRMTLFHPESRARRIVAANAGFYTLPDRRRGLPTGLAGTGLTDAALRGALGRDLTLLLGADDNDDEAGGTILHTPAVDAQGLGRLDRGLTFFRTARAKAAELGAPFTWKLGTVPGVGHDFAAMSEAAAACLFGDGSDAGD